MGRAEAFGHKLLYELNGLSLVALHHTGAVTLFVLQGGRVVHHEFGA